MSSFKLNSLVVSQATSPVNPTVAGDMSVAVISGHLHAYDGTTDRTIPWSTEGTGTPVYFYYRSDAGSTITNNSATVLKYEVKVYDTHNAYNVSTGIYTVPVAGAYYFDAKLAFSVAIGTQSHIQIFKNSTLTSYVIYMGTMPQYFPLRDTMLVECAVNDTITIKAYQQSGADRGIVSASPELVHFKGWRIA